MTKRAYTREDVVSLIQSKDIYYFQDIFYKCKYPIKRTAGAVSTNKDRLSSIISRPYDMSMKEMLRLAWYFDVHYLVIFILVERQIEHNEHYNKAIYISSFSRPKETYPEYILERLREEKEDKDGE